jgi:hypothetical protein
MYRSRSCGNVEIAQRFPRAVGAVGNCESVFHGFHGPAFPQLSFQVIAG